MLNEKEFIIQFAIRHFNQQYHHNLLVADCDAKSIQPNQFSSHAYEVFSVRLDDYVRMRLYLSFSTFDNLGPYRLEVDGSEAVNQLGDEVYVCSGTIDRYYYESGMYKFPWLNEDVALWNLLLNEDGDALLTESGEYILLEGEN